MIIGWDQKGMREKVERKKGSQVYATTEDSSHRTSSQHESSILKYLLTISRALQHASEKRGFGGKK